MGWNCTRPQNDPRHPQQLPWCPVLLLWCPLQSSSTNLNFPVRVLLNRGILLSPLHDIVETVMNRSPLLKELIYTCWLSFVTQARFILPANMNAMRIFASKICNKPF